jgi:hypothetical protein
MKIKIFVAHHKEGFVYRDEIFEPIQVGRAKSNFKLEMIGDDTGENISFKNSVYCELTAIYWAWKNCTENDYIGICHYRRYYSFNNPFFTLFDRKCQRLKDIVKRKYLFFAKRKFYDRGSIVIQDQKVFSKLIYDFTSRFKNEIISNREIDLYTLKLLRFHNYTVYDQLCELAGCGPIGILEKIVSDKYPAYSSFFKKTLNDNKTYFGNMIIMKNKLFSEYSNFIFDILEEFEYRIITSGWCINFLYEGCMSRYFGYLGELLTSIFIQKYYMDNINKVKHLNLIEFYPTKI